jgi:hypothetical protein
VSPLRPPKWPLAAPKVALRGPHWGHTREPIPLVPLRGPFGTLRGPHTGPKGVTLGSLGGPIEALKEGSGRQRKVRFAS